MVLLVSLPIFLSPIIDPYACLCLCIGIEKFWWSAKNHFNKRLLAAPAELDRERFEQMVLESVTSVPADKVHNLCSSNRAFVAKTLHESV